MLVTVNPEPQLKKIKCVYCGDAYSNHTYFYIDNLIGSILGPMTQGGVKHAPSFIKSIADFFPVLLFKSFIFFGWAKYSDDIDKANTFRSRVIWEEARRRGIPMEQIILWGKPLDQYRAKLNGKEIFFNSLPIPPKFLDSSKNWDNKVVLKKEFVKKGIPVPQYFELPFFYRGSLQHIFDKFKKPIIVKPPVGSLARHTITNIHTFEEFKNAIEIVKQISPRVVVEEHLQGEVCRATLVDGVLAGFEWASSPRVVGNGKSTIKELIEEKNKNRGERIGLIQIGQELHDHIGRLGKKIDDILPEGFDLTLSHRRGRLWGGTTREMVDEIHPSFVPILERAVKATGLMVAGFDCIIPDPEKPADSQHWGIIECNTLPFIDLHYYTLVGKPRNIAGMIWDLWRK